MEVLKNLQITQINLQRSYSASALLCKGLADLHTNPRIAGSIALVYEPWTIKNRVGGLLSSEFKVFSKLTDSRTRACIVVSRGLNVIPLYHLCTRDLTAIEVKISRRNRAQTIVFASIYLPQDDPAAPPPSREMTALIDYCGRNHTPLIIGCDANAHNMAWGCPDTNYRGRSLLEYILTTRLEIINRGHEPTFVVGKRRTIIDLTLVSRDILDEIQDWNVSREESLSDHRYIRFKVGVDPQPPQLRRNPRNTNWDSYKEKLGVECQGWPDRINSAEELDHWSNLLQQKMRASFEAACPLRKVRAGGRVPWWNQQLSSLRKNVRKMLRKALNSDTIQRWAEYRVARNEYKHLIVKAKREAWRGFCENIEGTRPTSRLYKILSRAPSYQVGMLQLPDGEYTSSEEEAISYLLQTHFPGSIPLPIDTTGTQGPGRVNWGLAESVVTPVRVKWAIQTFLPYKSAGPDGIFPALLQYGTDVLLDAITKLYQASVAMAHIPVPWREVRVVFIPKPGRGSYTLPKSFRPISLSSFLLKGLERLVERWWREGVLVERPLHNHQHAYQTGRSVETALHCLVGRIEKAIEAKEFALGAFFDIAGAFDSVSFTSMEVALRGRNVEPTLVKWTGNMLRLRTVSAHMGIHSKSVCAMQGCPQGGVLSPLLWSLVMDELISFLNQRRLFMQAYADDGVILIVGIDLSVISNLMQEALTHVRNWCRDKGLSVHPEKSELVLFTRRKNLEGLTLPSLNGVKLKLSDQVKFLGVILDNRLTWKAHLDTKCSKATVAFAQARRAIGTKWGLSPKSVRWLFTAVIRPMITYGAVVWWPRVKLDTTRKQLGRVQRLACLCTTGALNSTPTAALEVLLGLPPLDIHIQKEAMASSYRLWVNNTWNRGSTGHKRIWGRMRAISDVHKMHSDTRTPCFRFSNNFQTLFPVREEWKEPIADSNVCYTDGSRKSDRAGAGVAIPQEGVSLSLPLGSYATVFQAEVFAILECARHLLGENDWDKHIYICSDSQAALQALSNPKISSWVVSECADTLQRLAEKNRVTLMWVPGHSGIDGNEAADRLARQASSTPYWGPEPVIGIPKALVRTNLSNWEFNQHQLHWSVIDTCRQAKYAVKGIDKKITKQLLSLPRSKLRPLVGLLTGHYLFNRHLFNIGVVDTPLCPLCNAEDETSLHFLGACDALAEARGFIFGTRYLDTEDIKGLALWDLLRFIKTSKRFP